MATTQRYYRKVIKIKGEDSPNVRFALAQIAAGKEPTGEVIIPGVLPWNDYVKRRETWDKIRQCIGLDAEFWEGSEILLFPPDWLDRANRIADTLRGIPRKAKAIGCDPAEGGDKTSVAVIDELGLIELVSEKTPDTTKVNEIVRALMAKHRVPGNMVMFDRGGGGKQHVDNLRKKGVMARTVAFGEPPTTAPKRGTTLFADKLDAMEDRGSYVNRRAELYYDLSAALDPATPKGFGIPAVYDNLRNELSPIPKMYDREGKMRLLPKHKNKGDSDEPTLTELIGHSPDEADALAIAYHCMTKTTSRARLGAT